ncbi:MAG: UDP-3-O-acyl-N-acetylglucosamine deacetylase [Elusimicrobia bacterium]|nr:UDP-3-O-acyl-N-acetylglucosamine deacetylase [Candidatus Obscuribacterium magneticum]
MDETNSQKTIETDALVQGVGLHTGRPCQVLFKPAPAGTGILFIRTDLPAKPAIPARLEFVVDVVRGTTLGRGDVRIYTIEHLLSALNGLGLDNLIIELDDNEPPVLDGSAVEFVKALQGAGIRTQGASRNYFTVTSPVEYESNQTLIRSEPSDRFEIDCEINYDHPLLQSQRLLFSETDDYATQIAPARTFCFDYEIEGLKKHGLAKGGSLDNAIVIGPSGIYNAGTALRFDDEFVRHKIMDFMGDLMLIGARLRGKITARRCGHGHNIKFLSKLLEGRTNVPAMAAG